MPKSISIVGLVGHEDFRDMSDCLEAALHYAAMGLSVIPVRPDKKPWVAWAQYQNQPADEPQIRDWWKQWPGAGVAIVTGQISGLVVVDVDTAEGQEQVEALLPESLLTPISRSQSGGWHYYFRHPGGTVSNSTRTLPGVDIRGDGGYIVAPPTQGQAGTYSWNIGLALGQVELAELAESLSHALNINSFININVGEPCLDKISTGQGQDTITGDNCNENNNVTRCHFMSPEVTNLSGNVMLSFQKGGRDQSLFHVANCLVKGGMEQSNIAKVLYQLANTCSPPFSEKEASQKIESALNRAERKQRNLSAEIRDWVEMTPGDFSMTDCDKDLGIVTSSDKVNRNKVFERLVKEGIVERVGTRRGHYRSVNRDCETMDFLSANDSTCPISWPFGLEERVQIMPGNICVVAGCANSGKTGFLLNVVKMNMNRHKVFYFSSEMGAGELKKRLMLFDDIALKDWRFQPKERNSDFADVIEPERTQYN